MSEALNPRWKADLETLSQTLGEVDLMYAIGCLQRQLIEERRRYADPLAGMLGQEALKRALIIAAAGQHSVGLIRNGSVDPWIIEQAALALAIPRLEIALVCGCGNLGDTHLPCRCTPAQHERHARKHFDAILACDMRFEACRVPVQSILAGRIGTSLKDAQEQLARKTAYINDCLDETCLHLFRQCAKELGFGQADMEVTKRIARTIANVEQCAVLQAHHVSEAIQYRSPRWARI